jgi:F0F1-type ATP synthase assembly protein I
MQASGLVTQLVVGVILLVWLGSWLDQKLNSSPLMILLLSIGALIGGIYRLNKMLTPPTGEKK